MCDALFRNFETPETFAFKKYFFWLVFFFFNFKQVTNDIYIPGNTYNTI